MEDRYVVVRSDWQAEDMPLLHTRFRMRMHIGQEQLECLRFGHIPQEMEDKWFWYMEGNKLYAHRSWTGHCIFILTFREGSDTILVTANRDPGQYSNKSVRSDKETVRSLLGWWCREQYDYYHEWLAETVDMIEKSKKH